MNGRVFRTAAITIYTKHSAKKVLILFALICGISFLSVMDLKNADTQNLFTLTSALAWSFALPQRYFLLFSPLYIYLLYNLVKADELTLSVFQRVKNRSEFCTAQFATIIVFVIVASLMIYIVTAIIFSFAFPISGAWSTVAIYEQSVPGAAILNQSLHALPPTVVLLIQLVLIQLSNIALGFVLLLLTNVLRFKFMAAFMAILANFLLLFLQRECGQAISLFLPHGQVLLSYIDIDLRGGLALGLLRPVLYWLFLIIVFGIVHRDVFKHKDILHYE